MTVLDVIFPRQCFGCGAPGCYICMRCTRRIRVKHQQTCLYCGKPSPYGLTHPGCRRAGGIDGTVSLYYYDNILKSFIAGIKYRLVKDAFPDLLYVVGRRAGQFTHLYTKTTGGVVFSPIPQAFQRTLKRGFNQAAVLTRIFAHLYTTQTKIILEKKKQTEPQAQIKGVGRRRANMRGSFSLVTGCSLPERVVVVDDVITTGETAKEAARVLKKGGVKKVYVLSVAKG